MGSTVLSQGILVAEYTMNDCMLGDERSGLDAFFFGGNACVCGVRSNGMQFDGLSNFAEFPDGISRVLEGDFSLSFYVQFDPANNNVVDLFYYGNNCGSDSLFSVRYVPLIQEFRVNLSDSPNNTVQVSGRASALTCWQYVVITKSRSILRLYINGDLVDQQSAISDIRLDFFQPANLTIANSPCQRIGFNPENPFRGNLDEILIFNYPLNDREVRGANYKPNQIITPDTTIFLGDAVLIETGGTCTDQFSWSPQTDMINANTTSPIVNPSVSTTYEFSTNNEGCLETSQVRVNVVSRDEITCEDLLLPNAFTPNNDFVNDDFGISNLFLVENLRSFEIFDKWGGRVFYTENLSGRWDGFFNNSIVSSGAYVYKVSYSCQNEDFVKSGVVNVIR